VLTVLREKAKRLRLLGPRVLLRDDPEDGNRYSLLIAEQSLQSVIGELNEARMQIEAIYTSFIVGPLPVPRWNTGEGFP
jgi:hypothetical protein